jgi:hypothetical protein
MFSPFLFFFKNLILSLSVFSMSNYKVVHVPTLVEDNMVDRGTSAANQLHVLLSDTLRYKFNRCICILVLKKKKPY